MPLNKPSPRLAILRAQLAAEADAIRIQRASYKISNAVGCSCPVPAPYADSLPLPPDYWSDLEHWLKTLAPAKPAAEQPAKSQDASGWRRGQDVPVSERVGLWHYKTASGGDISEASQSTAFGFNCDGKYRQAAAGVKRGDPYDETKYPAPAQQPAQKASTESDYLVCIGVIPGKSIGDVVKQVGGGFDTDYWRRCDESGWVTHVPTADAVCPVPDGIDFEAKWPDGEVSSLAARHLRTSCIRAWSFDGGDVGGLSAWRPIAQS